MKIEKLEQAKFAMSVKLHNGEKTHINNQHFDITVEDTFFIVIRKKGSPEILAVTSVFNSPYFVPEKTTTATETTTTTVKTTLKPKKTETIQQVN